jgi:hypothetical protein
MKKGNAFKMLKHQGKILIGLEGEIRKEAIIVCCNID